MHRADNIQTEIYKFVNSKFLALPDFGFAHFTYLVFFFLCSHFIEQERLSLSIFVRNQFPTFLSFCQFIHIFGRRRRCANIFCFLIIIFEVLFVCLFQQINGWRHSSLKWKWIGILFPIYKFFFLWLLLIVFGICIILFHENRFL